MITVRFLAGPDVEADGRPRAGALAAAVVRMSRRRNQPNHCLRLRSPSWRCAHRPTTGVVDRGATCERIDEGPIKAGAGRPGFDDVALLDRRRAHGRPWTPGHRYIPHRSRRRSRRTPRRPCRLHTSRRRRPSTCAMVCRRRRRAGRRATPASKVCDFTFEARGWDPEQSETSILAGICRRPSPRRTRRSCRFPYRRARQCRQSNARAPSTTAPSTI